MGFDAYFGGCHACQIGGKFEGRNAGSYPSVFPESPITAGVALEDDDEPEGGEPWQEEVDDEENPSQADSVDGFGAPAEAATEEDAGEEEYAARVRSCCFQVAMILLSA